MSADEMLALLRDQRRSGPEERTSPVMSLPLRIQPARASALGWSPDLFFLTVLVAVQVAAVVVVLCANLLAVSMLKADKTN